MPVPSSPSSPSAVHAATAGAGDPPCGVCDGFKSFVKNEKEKDRKTGAGGSVKARTTKPAISMKANEYEPFPCPANSASLGAATWTFLHTMAAYYPEAPSAEEQKTMRTFFRTLSKVYPCSYCATHLREEMRTNPPQVESNRSLNLWLCGVHNEVNERLGKPTFDCSKVWERWRRGPQTSPEC